MSLCCRLVLVGQQGLGTSELFRLQIVLQPWPCTPGTQLYDRARGSHKCDTIEE